MNKRITIPVAGLVISGVVGLGGLVASAQATPGDETPERTGMHQGYGHQASLESRAQVLGMSADELNTALETKTMSQIAVEQGMDEATFHSKMLEAAKAKWEARGLSSEEIAQRIAEREAHHAANSGDHEFGSGEGEHHGGFGRHSQ